MRMIYMIAAAVLRGLDWEVEIKEKGSYWNLVLTNTTSSEDMPESHKSCLRGLLRGWLMEFNFEGGRQQVNIYKELHGLSPEDDRYSCLDTCVKRVDSNTPEHDLDDKEVFVRRKDRFDRYVLEEPVSEDITTELSTEQEAASRANGGVMLVNKPWIKSKEKLPKHCELVLCAWLDVQRESFQYYVGWYNADEKEWFLTDFGYTSDVAFWMPIPKLDMSDL